MKFRIFIYALLAVYALVSAVACTGCGNTAEKLEPWEWAIQRGYGTDVGFGVLHVNEKDVVVQFENRSGEYSHIVQEIYLQDGGILVECFRAEKGQVRSDSHFWKDRPHRRKMVVYAADVEGADERNGFAHLPKNIDGSVVTDIHPTFNEAYQLAYETRGRIVRRSPHQFEWLIVDDGEFVFVPRPAVKGGVE